MAVGHRGTHSFAFSWTAPLRGGGHGAAIRGEPDEHALAAVTLPGQLADVELATSSHLSGSSVTDMGVVLPHHDLRTAKLVIEVLS